MPKTIFKKALLFSLSLFSVCSFSVQSTENCVILLHGLARTENAMNKMSRSLKAEGYQVVNYGYPSTEYDINTLATTALPQALKQCKQNAAVHFVTHSMGGIILRAYLAKHAIPNLQHVVMLGPPNQGSEVVDKLGQLPGFEVLNGPAGMELGTHSKAVPKRLPKVNFKLGVIAGKKSINPILSTLIPGEDDGKVSIKNTKVSGMHDHITLPVTHTFMMRNPDVISQTRYFLKHAKFHKAATNEQTESN